MNNGMLEDDKININGILFNKNVLEISQGSHHCDVLSLANNEKLLNWLKTNNINVNKITFSFSRHKFNSECFFTVILPMLAGELDETHYTKENYDKCNYIFNTLSYYLSCNGDKEVTIIDSDLNIDNYLLLLENTNILKLFLNNFYISTLDDDIILVEFGLFNGERL